LVYSRTGIDTAQKPAAAHGLIERLLTMAQAFRRDNRPLFSARDRAALLRRNN